MYVNVAGRTVRLELTSMDVTSLLNLEREAGMRESGEGGRRARETGERGGGGGGGERERGRGRCERAVAAAAAVQTETAETTGRCKETAKDPAKTPSQISPALSASMYSTVRAWQHLPLTK